MHNHLIARTTHKYTQMEKSQFDLIFFPQLANLKNYCTFHPNFSIELTAFSIKKYSSK